MVKCFPDKNCQFFKFILPKGINIDSQNTENNILPNRLIGYWKENILFGVDNKTYYFNVAKAMRDYNPQNEETENMIPVSMQDLHLTTNSKHYYAVQFTAVDKETICLVIANSYTNYATFLKVKEIEPQKLHFQQMGIEENEGNGNQNVKTETKIAQFISVMYQSSKSEVYQAGMSMLSDGTLHFYCEYKLKANNSQVKGKIVQIGTDLESFYFRFEHDTDQYFCCKIKSHHRIGFNSSETMKCQNANKQFENFLHRRICYHFQMFKTFSAFKNYFVIAYRNRLIFLLLTNEKNNFCVDQLKLPDDVIFMNYIYINGLTVITESNEFFLIGENRKVLKTQFLFSKEEVIVVQNNKYLLTKTLKQKQAKVCKSGYPLKKFTSPVQRLNKDGVSTDGEKRLCSCGVKLNTQSQPYFTCGNASCDCDYCEECYEQQCVPVLSCKEGHPIQKFEARASLVNKNLIGRAQVCDHCRCKINENDTAEYACGQGCNYYCCKTCFDPKREFFIKRGNNFFRNYDPKIEKEGESALHFYLLTSKYLRILLLSSYEDEVNVGVALADLDENTQFGAYSYNATAKEGGLKLNILIDTPPKDGKAKISSIFTVTQLKKAFEFRVTKQIEFIHNIQDTGKLIAVLKPKKEERFGKLNDCIVRVTTESIAVYDKDFEFQIAFFNMKIVKIGVQDDLNFISCMLNASDKKLMVQKKDQSQVEALGNFPEKFTTGVFVLDFGRMLQDFKIELYQVSKTITGINTHIDSRTIGISFIENFATIQILPQVNLSIINLIGIEPKRNYLIWRQKNGFFTAFQKQGKLHTWSMVTGKHLFEQPNDKLAEAIKEFSVYKSCPYDNSYERSDYNGSNSTVQLLFKSKPIRLKTKQTSDETMFTQTEGTSEVGINFELEKGTFEFKVLELKMHQDFVDDNTCKAFVDREHVCELFSFEFDLLIKPQQVGVKTKEMDDSSRLVLSQDTKKLMVIIDDNVFSIYTRQEPSPGNKKIEWKLDPKRKNVKYPSLQQGNIKTNFLFDPTFEYMIVCNYQEGCFEVCETTGKSYRCIPTDLIEFNTKSPEAIIVEASRMFFKTESTIEYIGPDGLWVILNIHKDFKVENYALIKNWKYRDQSTSDNAFNRILRMGQWSEVQLESAKHSETIEKANNLQRFNRKKETYQRQLLSSVFRVEIYSLRKKKLDSFYRVEQDQIDYIDDTYRFQAEASFTILDLLILEQILNNSKVENMAQTRALQSMLNIFPCRFTTLHIFVQQCFRDVEDAFDADGAVFQLFKMALNGSYEIPIIESYQGETPMDIALGVQGKSQLSSHFTLKVEKNARNEEITSITMASILFACTKDYSFLHSAHSISEAIIKAIELQVPQIGEFIQGRLKVPNHLPNASQRPIIKQVRDEFKQFNNETGQSEILQYGVKTIQVFSRTKAFQDAMFGGQGPKRIFQMFQLDIPYVHLRNKQGISFIEALSSTLEVDMFLLPSIQAIINFHWNSKAVKSFLWLGLITPYICELILFIYWSNFSLKQNDEGSSIQIAVEATLLALCAWFLMIEVIQVTQKGSQYFTGASYWNVIQIVPLLLIPINISRHLASGDAVLSDAQFWNVQSVAAITLWLNSLYLLRSFDKTGYLIRSLSEVIKDMTVFLFVLSIVVFGFADAFGSVNQAQPFDDYEKFISGEDYASTLLFSYNRLAIWDLNEASLLASLLLIAGTLTEVIVMLNLLIAIVSATFERVTDSSVQYSFKEKVCLISDIYDTFSGLIRNKPDLDKTDLMFLVKEDETNRETIVDDDHEARHRSIKSLIVEEMKFLKEEVKALKGLPEDVKALKDLPEEVKALKGLPRDMKILKDDMKTLKGLKE